MNIKSAEFEISNTDVKKCPEGFKPEYAFIAVSYTHLTLPTTCQV